MPTRINPTIDQALYDWLKGQIDQKYGAKVIWSKQTAEGNLNGKRLELPFATMSILNNTKVKGSLEEIPTENVGEFQYQWTMNLTMQFNFFASDEHFDMATWVQGSLELPTVKEALREAGLSLRGYEQVNDLSQVLNDKYELRTQFDVHFSYIMERVDTPSEITKVFIEGEVEGRQINLSLDKENP